MRDVLNVTELVAAHLHEVLLSTVLADQDTKLHDDVSRLILKATDAKLVKWVFKDFFEEIFDNLWLLKTTG